MRDEGLGEELEKLFDDFLASLDLYTEFLSEIELIETLAKGQAREDIAKSSFKSGFAGGSAFAEFKNHDASTSEAALGALLIGGTTMALDLWKPCPAYEWAKLQWLEGAIERGMFDIATIHRDPRLARLRAAAPGQVRALTEVKASWSITWGTIYDDIVLKNESNFPLTNVKLQYDLKQDAKSWNKTLTAIYVAPGESRSWRNEVSIPNRRLTSKSLTLECDQGVQAIAPQWIGSHR